MAKVDGDAVGEADDDVPLQLKTRVVSHRVVQALVPVVGYNINYVSLIPYPTAIKALIISGYSRAQKGTFS